VALGLGLLLALRRGAPARGWVEAGVLADAGDLAATLAGGDDLPALGRYGTAAFAASGAALGLAIAASAFLIAFGVDKTLQQKIGDYTHSLQAAERSCSTQRRLGYHCVSTVNLADLGPAPDFRGITHWFNSKPLTVRELRGKVVLVDFWTYSCINCLRTLPHLRAWWREYHRAGLEIVGVHTPEFAFEAEPSNVRSATRDLRVRWPVALDPDYATFKAYRNEYWPAEYLIDKQGHIRHEHFGEGEYGRTEQAIRQLLGEPGPARAELADMTPTELITPETYLGYDHQLERYAGSQPVPGRQARYIASSALPQNEWALWGNWRLGPEHTTAGRNAALGLHFHAKDVYLVMGGRGRVGVSVNGHQLEPLRVRGISRLYTVLSAPHLLDAQLRLSFTPGISVYSFTFG
jgi:thiol-disulfide isomerase/thioredoxin